MVHLTAAQQLAQCGITLSCGANIVKLIIYNVAESASDLSFGSLDIYIGGLSKITKDGQYSG
jgi:hypothetical protein